VSASDALSFRCTGCGNCCRDLHVAVTSADVARLVAATGRPAADLVSFLAPDAVDMSGEPDSFIELREGRRLMVLRRENGACHLLDAEQRCSVYDARPRDCAAFPFEVEPHPSNPSTDEPQVRRLELLQPGRCEAAFDADNDVRAIAATDSRRNAELRAYRSEVAEFNRQVARRRRFGHRIPDAQAFVEFLLASRPSVTP
jgi:Fe-S-cluster containining protein